MADNREDRPREDRNGRSNEDRYRDAATNALEMIDWCIGYLAGIHKDKIASRLARKRSYVKDLMYHPEEQRLDLREIAVLLDRLKAALNPADERLTR
jgi:hypothetical protein